MINPYPFAFVIGSNLEKPHTEFICPGQKAETTRIALVKGTSFSPFPNVLKNQWSGTIGKKNIPLREGYGLIKKKVRCAFLTLQRFHR